MGTNTRGLASEGSPPDLRGQLAALLGRAISLDQFQRWFGEAEDGIELYGSDADLDLWGTVFNRMAEYTGEYLDADHLYEALADDLREAGGIVPEPFAKASSDRELVTAR